MRKAEIEIDEPGAGHGVARRAGRAVIDDAVVIDVGADKEFSPQFAAILESAEKQGQTSQNTLSVPEGGRRRFHYAAQTEPTGLQNGSTGTGRTCQFSIHSGVWVNLEDGQMELETVSLSAHSYQASS
jgi:hypothetical protein